MLLMNLAFWASTQIKLVPRFRSLKANLSVGGGGSHNENYTINQTTILYSDCTSVSIKAKSRRSLKHSCEIIKDQGYFYFIFLYQLIHRTKNIGIGAKNQKPHHLKQPYGTSIYVPALTESLLKKGEVTTLTRNILSHFSFTSLISFSLRPTKKPYLVDSDILMESKNQCRQQNISYLPFIFHRIPSPIIK
jgi:hypothetical protein